VRAAAKSQAVALGSLKKHEAARRIAYGSGSANLRADELKSKRIVKKTPTHDLTLYGYKLDVYFNVTS
jgi:hypothetical protein